MAKDSSFDVVSTIDIQEVDNAYQQAQKELSQRYDLKDTSADISFNKAEKTIEVVAPAEFVLGQVKDILNSKLARRGVDLQAISWQPIENASGGNLKQTGVLVEGIEKDIAKKISKDIRNLKKKAKVSIEGDKLRVSSPKKDTLQEIIAFLKDQDYGQPLQFVNYR